MPKLDRRSLLVGGGLLLSSACSRQFAIPGSAAETDRPLPIPALLDARQQGQVIALSAQAGRTSFYPGRPSDTLGYNGSYLGPTLRVHRGDEVKVAVTNRLSADTTVHWHGLLIPGELDGGPHQLIPPGTTWRPNLPVRQPAATLLYHSHVHGLTAEQVYSGLAGMLIVTDQEEQGLGLPSDYGVDDLPLLIQDRQFQDGRLVMPAGMMTAMQGRRGDTILVNGAPNPLAAVPNRLVRLRLVNGSNARIYDLSFSDGRGFHWIGTEGGLLERSVALRSLTLAPGQRAEILVDFADGRTVSLVTGPDANASMMGMMGSTGMMGGRSAAAGPTSTMTVLRFAPRAMANSGARTSAPDLLVPRVRPDPTKAVRRRRLVLNMGMGGMMGAGGGMTLTINGKPFDRGRVDERVRLGDVEIWEVSGQMMKHPIHIHGVHFDVLRRDGGRPDLLDQGARDTVLVKEPVELLIRFDQPASTAPFMYHCHVLEHEDNGMMGQFTVS
ncbi:multicopper oxidase domain-containing protein [Paeniroseomonas aquatica]|uniref:Multicopper oxidase domain-containing protein n=1 Tax=Paeniroseomonas aquatica TaxID=373043 RepID=A0ABT8A1Z7_9PROT|nr:multicopper oxidase domain-containing protein [Paeniroseomonas aquatica]MDN3563518.1 multicopper oxidase domain-containing protein [Paeniroseomonas aquatica]